MEKDSLLEDAIRVILNEDQGSPSLLQRKLKIGYNRAGRIMDQLEYCGLIGPHNGSNPRDILVGSQSEAIRLISSADWEGEEEDDNNHSSGQSDEEVKQQIIDLLLRKNGEKMSPKDISGFLDLEDEEKAKTCAEALYYDYKILRDGNRRFYLTDKVEMNSGSNSESSSVGGTNDMADELKKFKTLLDEGLITQEDYDNKKKQLLGL
jgi:hypothetical protein